MTYSTLIVETGENFVGTITLNRPDQLNTFTTPLAIDLQQALLAMDADPKVRAVLVRGAGKAFCAGIDVNELEGKTAMEYREWIERMELPLVTISRMNKPVIAQVHGVAAANGMGLVAACDLAIVSVDTRMGLTAINVGLNCVGPILPVVACADLGAAIGWIATRPAPLAIYLFGATREEVMETMGMAIYMGAGPSVMYAAQAVEAYDQFKAKAAAAA